MTSRARPRRAGCVAVVALLVFWAGCETEGMWGAEGAEGEPCGWLSQCRKGLICDGVCLPPGGVGDACMGNAHCLDDGLECCFMPLEYGHRCQDSSRAGCECSSSHPCGDGYLCNLSGMVGGRRHCQRIGAAPEGTPCDVDAVCSAGLTCHLTSEPACTAPGSIGPGAPCTGDAYCVPGTGCTGNTTEGICVALGSGGKGAPCAFDNHCSQGLRCNVPADYEGWCAEDASVEEGEACKDSSFCADGLVCNTAYKPDLCLAEAPPDAAGEPDE